MSDANARPYNYHAVLPDHELQEIRPVDGTTARRASSQHDSDSAQDEEGEHEALDSSRSSQQPKLTESQSDDDRQKPQNVSYRQWRKPLIFMVLLILLGLAFAIAHHCFNQSLHHKPVETFSQTWSRVLGQAAGFGLKSSCTLAIALACQQVLWYTMQRQAIRISTIDDMFTLLSNPLSFTPSAIRRASVLASLAAISWIIPVAAILSAGTLTVSLYRTEAVSTCIVPTFPANASRMYSILQHTDGRVMGPNTIVKSIGSQVFTSGETRVYDSPCGQNCTYRQVFFGPALQCSSVGNYMNSTNDWDMRTFRFYDAESQVARVVGGGGADGAIYQQLQNETQPPYSMSLSMRYRNTSVAINIFQAYTGILGFVNCTAYNATYDVSVIVTNGKVRFEPIITPNAPLFWVYIDSTMVNHQKSSGFSMQANYQSLVNTVFNQLIGDIIGGPTTQNIQTGSLVVQTSLATVEDSRSSSGDWLVTRDLVTGVPELLSNLTLSMISLNSTNETVTCTTSTEYQAYEYDPLLLLLPYSLALLAAVVSTGVASWTFKKIGFRTGGAFSQVLVTTRNITLDEMAEGNSLSSVCNDSLRQQKLVFGTLISQHAEDGQQVGEMGYVQHAAFGPATEIKRIKPTALYI